MNELRILIVEDEKDQLEALVKLIKKHLEYLVIDAINNYDSAIYMAKNVTYFAAIVDLGLGSPKGDGRDVIIELAKNSPFCSIIIRSQDPYNRSYDIGNQLIDNYAFKNAFNNVIKILDSQKVPTEGIDFEYIRSFNKTVRRRKSISALGSDDYFGKDIIDMLKKRIEGGKSSFAISYKGINYIPGTKIVNINGEEKTISLAQGDILAFFMKNPNTPHRISTIYYAFEAHSRGRKNDYLLDEDELFKKMKKDITNHTTQLEKILGEDYYIKIDNKFCAFGKIEN